jgi:hypothetical protein
MQMNDRKTFLSSFLTDNAISIQEMRLLQLDLELSVQCPMSVHKRRSTVKVNRVESPIQNIKKKGKKRKDLLIL